MTLLAIITTRAVKLFGNLCKIFFLAHRRVWPGKRYHIPKHAPAIWQRRSPRKIPRIVWQTNYTDSVTLPVYLNYHWNRLLSPTCEHFFWLDDDADSFIEKNFSPSTVAAFRSLQIGAAKADFWRVLVLYKIGGIYLDVDAAFVYPIEATLKREDDSLYIRDKQGKVTNYFFASAPGHEILGNIVDVVQSNIERNEIKSVFDMTGPGVFESVVTGAGFSTQRQTYICRQGVFIKKAFQYPENLSGYWVEDEKHKTVVKSQDSRV